MDNFIRVCQLLGVRTDLIQAGGGNASLKKDGHLFIKGSGKALASVTPTSNLAKLNLSGLMQDLATSLHSVDETRDRDELVDMGEAILKRHNLSNIKPSIETFFHAFFESVTLHCHPTVVSYFVSNQARFESLKLMFPQAHFVDYHTPGIELFLKMKPVFAADKKELTVVFLANHGLIVSADDAMIAFATVNDICHALSQRCGYDDSAFQHATLLMHQLGQYYHDATFVSLMESESMTKQFLQIADKAIIPFNPDIAVYLGRRICQLDDEMPLKSIKAYLDSEGDLPVLMTFKQRLFMRFKHFHKQFEIEQMCRNYLAVSDINRDGPISGLSSQEVARLLNWDAEIFRQNH